MVAILDSGLDRTVQSAWLISKTGPVSSSQLLANFAFLTEIVAVMFVCKLLSLSNILSLASGKSLPSAQRNECLVFCR